MKNKLKPYRSAIAQGLSTRAMARVLNIPTTTAWRRANKIKVTGALVHGNTGHQNRKPNPDKHRIIDAANKYIGFSIAHTVELLFKRDGITVNPETLRRWLNRPKIRKAPKQRARRECREAFGELLQIDGSFHNWFGDKKSCMINIVDDATNMCELRFDGQETIESACHAAWAWIKKYGVPRAFYADGRNMYHLNPDAPHNFFTAMCQALGIRVILAHSPQAKGRVERFNGVHQHRLIPLLRLDGVRDMESANKYLENYIMEHNRRFRREPRNLVDAHTRLPDWAETIDDVCVISVERQLNNDWTFSYNGKIYHIPRQSVYPPAKSKVQLRIGISGRITAYCRRSVFNVQ